MKKILSFFILSLFFISCSSDDNFTEPRNNGFIELDYNGEKLLFGKKSYNGWVLMEDNRQDTIAFTYTSRIDLEGVDFYEIQMEVYLNKDNQVKDVKMN